MFLAGPPILLLCLGYLFHIAGASCFFPVAWHGEYFHLGYSQPLIIINSTISGKGRCLENMGSQYIMEDKEYGERCWRCMTIFRKHHNVLQYRESYCEAQVDSFASLCMNIAGDSPMYSLFRRNSDPIKCPFKGPFTFSYSKGGTGSVCSYPKSYMDSCEDGSRLQFHFQACTDVQGSESTTEELQCIAAWKEGSKKYLVAELNREHMYSDESKFRCFVYEQKEGGEERGGLVRMAQSEAATCSGLWSAQEGFRTFDMETVEGSSHRCVYPDWLTLHHTWTSVDGATVLHINSGERSLRLTTPTASIHLTCQDLIFQDSGRELRLVSYLRSGCNSGYLCSHLSRAASGALYLQLGSQARIPGEACSDLYTAPWSTPPLLLVARSQMAASSCGLAGRYSLAPLLPHPAVGKQLEQLASCRRPDSLSLTAGCGSSQLLLEARCPGTGSISRVELRCHAHWTEDGESRLVVSAGSKMLCISQKETLMGGGGLTSSSSRSCSSVDSLQLRLSQTGPCIQALSSTSDSGSGGLSLKASVTFLSLAIASTFVMLLL